jgi:lysozyme family protein
LISLNREVRVMTLRSPALVVAWSLLSGSACAFAQELENFPDAALTGEQWQQRVQEARRRSQEFVANARTQKADPAPSDKEDAEAADPRALNDPSLQPGDIIATSQGFVVFVGHDEEHQPSDFLAAPNSK